ncbi:MAG: type II secretion system protein GspC [Pseudomonadota bacterium]
MTTDPTWSDLASGDPARTIAAANHLLPFWVSLLLVVLIGWQLAGVVWSLVPGSSTGDTVNVPPGMAATSSAGAVADVQSIANASLFGKADPDEAVTEQAPVLIDTTVETKLNLTLKGTIASNIEAESAAIIQVGPRDDQVFVIGNTVTNGARLQAIENRRVILNENGQLTELKLPEDFKSTPQPARRSPASRQRAATTRTTPQRNIQSVVSQNAARLSDVIRPTPYFVNGQQQGYRVYPGRDRRQFAALGLKAGDLIKDIDGQSLSDPQQAMQIFQSLGNAQQVTVTVERNGTPETIVLKTDQLDVGNVADEEGK